MVEVFTEGHDYYYEVTDIMANYCQRNSIQFVKERASADKGTIFVKSILTAGKGEVFVECEIIGNGCTNKKADRFELTAGKPYEVTKQCKRYVKHNLLRAAEEFFEKPLPWGILTGIRPVKMVHKLMDCGLKNEDILRHLTSFYKLAPDRAQLGIDIAMYEREFIFPYNPKKVSVYISIPFCPTRCSYCSFPSNEIARWGHFTGRYVEVLTEEIQAAGRALAKAGLSCDTVYIGGGTPTSLDLKDLDRVLNAVKEHLIVPETREYTIEAGRPDTLNRAKLELMKEYDATRISINPQTMNAVTLKKIGRDHSPEDIVYAFEMARKTGHDNINMDIIMGLPGEDKAMAARTLGFVKDLNPENVTVHTLAIKRASKLHEEEGFNARWVKEKEVQTMMELATDFLQDMGMNPYYLYRQKYMVGNLENIGFCLPGFEGIYNMRIMEEKQTILGLGAGATTKLIYLDEDRLERKQNPKSLEHYINRAEDIVEGWQGVINLLKTKT